MKSKLDFDSVGQTFSNYVLDNARGSCDNKVIVVNPSAADVLFTWHYRYQIRYSGCCYFTAINAILTWCPYLKLEFKFTQIPFKRLTSKLPAVRATKTRANNNAVNFIATLVLSLWLANDRWWVFVRFLTVPSRFLWHIEMWNSNTPIAIQR